MFTSEGVHGWKNISLGGKAGAVGVLKMNKDGIAWRSKGGQGVSVVGSELIEAQWLAISTIYQIRLKTKNGKTFKFDGFTDQDEAFLKTFFKDNFSIEIEDTSLSTKGWNWGEFKVKDSSLSFFVSDEKTFDIPLSEVSQAGVTSAKSNEVALEFHQDDTTGDTVESLVKMKLFFPKDESTNGNAAKEQLQKFLSRVLAKADVDSTGKGLLGFKEVPILTPRGRYEIEMYTSFMKMHGKTYEYKIKYSSIVRLFQLPKPDGRHQMFVVSLEPPIRQGHVAFPHIVMQLSETEEIELKINVPKELENDTRIKQIQSSLGTGTKPLSDLVPRVFKTLTGKHVTVPKTFKSKEGGAAIKCLLKSYEGYLFPLERSFFFVHKPPTHIRFDEITSVDFQRVSNDNANKTFDLGINLNNGTQIQFKSLIRDEYSPLFKFFTKKKIPIENLQEGGVAGLPEPEMIVSDNESEGSASNNAPTEKKKRASRATAKDVRQRVRQAMNKEQIESDESDQDFGFNAQNPEEEDVNINSDDEVNSAEVRKEPAKEKEKEKEKEKPEPSKKRKRDGE